MANEIIMAIVGVISASISSVVTWLLSKRKEDADVDNTVIKGMKESLQFYEALCDDTKKRLDDAMSEREQLNLKIEAQAQALEELRREVLRLSVSICYNMSCELRKVVKK